MDDKKPTSEKFADTTPAPAESELQPIDANKVYPTHLFWAAVGISSAATQKLYKEAGLIVRKAVGRKDTFVLGKDWYDFLNRPENIASELDDSAQPAPTASVREELKQLRTEFDNVAEFANEEFACELTHDLDTIRRTLSNFEERIRDCEISINSGPY